MNTAKTPAAYSFVFGAHFGTADQIADVLRAEAEAAHKAFPQYAGHWDGWTIGYLTSDVKTKAGLAGSKGEAVLLSPVRETFNGIDYRTFYSRTNRCDTMIAATKVRG